MASASKRAGKRSGARPACSAVIAAAGSSERMGGEDKLFLEIGGAPVLAYSLSAFQNAACIDEIIIVAREDKFEEVGRICERFGIDKAAKVMTGGSTRLESVMNGVFAVSKKTDLIAIHDGARPFIARGIIERTVEEAALFYAAAPGVPVTSTLKTVKDGIIRDTIAREGLIEIQTPQVFDADLIKAALTNAVKKAVCVTDDCMAAELIGTPVHVTEGSALNIKITTSEDFRLACSIADKGGALYE